jgi:hypothetical protein
VLLPVRRAEANGMPLRLQSHSLMFLSPARGEVRRGGIDVRGPLTQPLPLAGERRLKTMESMIT